MNYVCHNRQVHKLRHNVETCLRHVSMQTTMYQDIGSAASREPSALGVKFDLFAKTKMDGDALFAGRICPF